MTVPAAKAMSRLGAGAGKALLLLLVLAACIVPCMLIADATAYVPLVTAVVLVSASWGCLQATARSLEVDQLAMAQSCLRGQSVRLAVAVRNRSVVPVTRMELCFFISDIAGGHDVETEVSCAVGSRCTLDLGFDATFAHLGSYECGVDHVVVRDLTGLFSKRVELSGAQRVAVRPKLFDVGDADLAHVAQTETDALFQPIASEDADYAGVRDYRYGDPMKSVHWNLTGRDPSGRMYTRLYEVSAEPGLAVIVDPYAPDYDADGLMGAFDALVESAASVSEAARLLGVDAEVRYLAADGGPASVHLSRTSDVEALVRDMMPARPSTGAAAEGEAAEMLRSEAHAPQGRGNVAYCTSLLTDDAAESLAGMKARKRNPLCFMAVPRDLPGEEREARLAPLKRLAAAGVPYYVIETNEAVTEVRAS